MAGARPVSTSTARLRSTFIIGAALAAVAGTMYLMHYGVVSFYDGFVPLASRRSTACRARRDRL